MGSELIRAACHLLARPFAQRSNDTTTHMMPSSRLREISARYARSVASQLSVSPEIEFLINQIFDHWFLERHGRIDIAPPDEFQAQHFLCLRWGALRCV